MGIDSDRWPTIEIDDDDDIPFYSPLNPTKVPLSPTISMMIFLGQHKNGHVAPTNTGFWIEPRRIQPTAKGMFL